MATFKIDLDPVPVEVTNLSNTDRALLRSMAETGGPLWKILRAMLDYGAALRENLIMVDLDDESQRKAARKVQSTIQAVEWVRETFELAMTDLSPPAPAAPPAPSTEEENHG